MKLKPDHTSNENELPQGGHGHPFWGWRAWWYRDQHCSKSFAVEWYAGRRSTGTHIGYARDGAEGEHTISVGVRWLCSLYVSWPARPTDEWDRKGYGVRIHHGAIWFEWANGDDWSSTQPWWQAFSFNPADFFLGRTEVEHTVLEEVESTMYLPEGAVPVKVKLGYSIWHRPRWPFVIGRSHTGTVTAIDPNGIGVPGKGESAWDCGDNNIQSMGCMARTVEEAIGEATKAVLRTRKRHGGSHVHTPVGEP